jgi:hypothetical protein
VDIADPTPTLIFIYVHLLIYSENLQCETDSRKATHPVVEFAEQQIRRIPVLLKTL